MAGRSTKELAATLPRKAPNTEQHRAVLNTAPYQHKYQIYSLAALDDAALARLARDVNTGDPEDENSGGNSALSKEAGRFAGRSLRDVYDHHIEARNRDKTVHPLYFIVADSADWKTDGLLVVHLDCGYVEGGKEGGEDCVGVGRCGVDWADSWGVNIDIGNMDWMELKEMEETDWGGDDPYEGLDDEDEGEDEDEDEGEDDDGKEDGDSGRSRKGKKDGEAVRRIVSRSSLEPGG